MTTLSLRYRGQVITMSCAAAAAREWLRAYLCPPFVEVDPAPGPRVEVVFDRQRYLAILHRELAPGEPVATFTRDPEHQQLRRWGRAGLLWDERAQAFLAGDGARVELVAAEDVRRARVTLMRVFRELATHHALALGDVPLHGAAAATAAGATVAVGPKGAGKTTFLLHALSQPGVAYLANDRVLVDREGVARGMTTIIQLREGSADFCPALSPSLFGRRLSPAELRAALGVRDRSEAPLARVAFLRLDPATPRFAIERLAPAEAAARLERDGLVAGGTTATFFARPDRPPVREGVRALAARVPCYAVALGARAYEPPSVWTALAEAR